MARDRPSPYGIRNLFSTVARGPVPRDLPINTAWRGTGPRPTVRGPFCEEDARYRSAGACPPRSPD